MGLNPKVNQLVGMARAARAIFVISDYDIGVPDLYLADIAAHLLRPGVACVTHPSAGPATGRWGRSSTTCTSPRRWPRAWRPRTAWREDPWWSASRWRSGGRTSCCWRLRVGGQRGSPRTTRSASGFRRELRAGVAVSSLPVWNIAVEKSVGHFFRRYLRWSVIHRTAMSFPTYLAESLLNPIPLAVIGCALRPTAGAATTLAVCAVLKPTLDAVAFSRLRRELFSWRAFGVVWVKDLLLFVTWVHGLFARTVVGGGTGSGALGSRLVPLAKPTPSGDSDVTGFSEKLPALHGRAAALMSDCRA